MSSDERGYEPPEVEEMPAEDGPAVTAAGKSPPTDFQEAAEWRRDEEPAGD
jgi:hypothetical protein